MIKLLLVDDEPIIRRGIRTSIEWESYGIEITGEAANGAEALDKVFALQPDIVLTDIRMPVMDGLELSSHLKIQLPHIRVVILSGHEDFSYAKQALSLGVNDYLLKPAGAEELVALMDRLSDEIRLEEDGKQKKVIQNLIFNENYPSIKSSFINKLLKGEYASYDAIREKSDLLNLNLLEQEYSIITIDIDDLAIMTENRSVAEKQLLKFSVMNIAEEIIASRASGVVCYSEFEHLIGLLGAKRLTEAIISDLCNEIQNCVKKYSKLSVSIGIGTIRQSTLDLPVSYAEAVSALREKIYVGKGSIIKYSKNIEQEQARPILYPSEEEKAVIHCLQTLNKQDLSSSVTNFFSSFFMSGASVESIRNMCGRLIIIALSSVEDMGVDVQNDFGSRYNPYKESEKFDTLKDLHQWMLLLLERMTELVSSNKSMRFKSLVKTALHYMQENYYRELSLREVAEVVYVTPNYLSRIFKEEMGVAFTEWLNRYRVEKAKILLVEIEAKTYSVAEKVGFNDYKYFSHIFKKHTGYSPQTFRELMLKQ